MDITTKLPDLSDLELAMLLCYVADQRTLIIYADPDQLADVGQELELIARQTFGLSSIVLNCSNHTTTDEFVTIDASDSLTPTTPPKSPRRPKVTPSILIAKNLNDATQTVQLQVFESIRNKQFHARERTYEIPTSFLLIALLPTGSPKLTNNNDYVFISHTHRTGDFLPHLFQNDSDEESLSSVIRAHPSPVGHKRVRSLSSSPPLIPITEISRLQKATTQVTISNTVLAYIHDLINSFRSNRYLSTTGPSSTATVHLSQLSCALAALHGIDYVPPPLVDLAVRKVYPHRLALVKPDHLRGLAWIKNSGTREEQILRMREVLATTTVEEIMEQVIAGVESPL